MPTLIDLANLTPEQQTLRTAAVAAANAEQVYQRASRRLQDWRDRLLGIVDGVKTTLAPGTPESAVIAAAQCRTDAAYLRDEIAGVADAKIAAWADAYQAIRGADPAVSTFAVDYLYSAAYVLAATPADGSQVAATVAAMDASFARPEW